jgi:hypothetical protein
MKPAQPPLLTHLSQLIQLLVQAQSAPRARSVSCSASSSTSLRQLKLLKPAQQALLGHLSQPFSSFSLGIQLIQPYLTPGVLALVASSGVSQLIHLLGPARPAWPDCSASSSSVSSVHLSSFHFCFPSPLFLTSLMQC